MKHFYLLIRPEQWIVIRTWNLMCCILRLCCNASVTILFLNVITTMYPLWWYRTQKINTDFVQCNAFGFMLTSFLQYIEEIRNIWWIIWLFSYFYLIYLSPIFFDQNFFFQRNYFWHISIHFIFIPIHIYLRLKSICYLLIENVTRQT